MSNCAEQRRDGPVSTSRPIIGKCKLDTETGKCVHSNEDSGCCSKNRAATLGVGPSSTQPGHASESCAGSCCDDCTPHDGEKSTMDCKDACCDHADQSVPSADQCCNVDSSTICPSPDNCTDPHDTEDLGCGEACCERDITEPSDSIALDILGPQVDDPCPDSCCASDLTPHANNEVATANNPVDLPIGPEAAADTAESSSPLQPSTVRRRAGKELKHSHVHAHCHDHDSGHHEHFHGHIHRHEHDHDHEGDHKHHHHHHHHHPQHSSHKDHKQNGKRNGQHDCARTVFGRFYEVACCCVLSSLKRTSEASKRKHATARSEPLSDPLQDIERTGGEDGRRAMKMSIQGMDCPSCGKRVAAALLTLPSVREPKVNTFAGEATLLYSDTVIAAADIARRATTLTGFRCEAIDERDGSLTNPDAAASRIRRLRVRISATQPGVPWDIPVPLGVTIHSAKRSGKDKWICDVDYEPKVIQPRAVLANFAQFDGVHIPQSHGGTSNVVRKDLVNLLIRTTISSVCCIPVLILSWAPIPYHPIAYGSINLVLTTIIQLYVALPIYSSALRSMFLQHIIDMDLLVVMSTSIAYIYSVVAFALQAAGHKFSDQFFETSALLVTLIMLGRLVSAYARRRASSALDDLAALQPREVILVHPSAYGPSTSWISEELVHTGDVLRILPDTLVPTDGTVAVGSSEVDESSITGESIPVAKQPGSALIAGTLNLSGVLEMQITRVPAESTLADIARLMRDAQDAAAALPVQDRADRVAAHLAPVVLVLSIATFAVWMFVGVYVRHGTRQAAGIAALKYAIAVMVISCPCAIALAVPMVVVLAVSVAAKRGVLFKSVVAVQYAKDVSVAVFDKTGTLTEGVPRIVQARLLRSGAAELVLALTSNSKHPISKAVAMDLASTPTTPSKLEDFRSIPGSGIEARYDGKVLRGGAPRWLHLESHPTIVEMESERLTLFVVTHGEEMIAAFGLQDGLRAGASEAVDLLQRRGVEVHIVSGDAPGVVSALAANLKVAPQRAVGGCKPQDKQRYVKALQSASRGGNPPTRRVMFFGDGTNDSLALVEADVGVSLGSGTDVAMSAADIIYMDAKNLARSIRTTLDVSEGAVLRIQGNFAWSVVYNTFAILLASGAFVHARIPPQYAGLGEMISVLPVVLIAWSMTLLKK